MMKCVCDKCGEEINTNPMSQTILPHYKIIVTRYLPYTQEINLCPECEKQLDRWIKNEKE